MIDDNHFPYRQVDPQIPFTDKKIDYSLRGEKDTVKLGINSLQSIV